MLPQITGEFRAVDDATLRFTPSGVAVSEVRIVANSRKLNKDTNEWEDDKVVWLTLVCFKKLAENVAESVTKGKLINVTGKLQTESYETKEGEKRQAYKVIADNVGLSMAFQAAKWVGTSEGAGTGAVERITDGAQADDPFATPAPATGTDEPPF